LYKISKSKNRKKKELGNKAINLLSPATFPFTFDLIPEKIRSSGCILASALGRQKRKKESRA
jgi:hypothetical protein